MGFCVEWEDLCRRQDEVIVFLEEAAHGLIPGAADGGGGDDVGGAELEENLHLEMRLRAQLRTLGGVLVEIGEGGAELPGAQHLHV